MLARLEDGREADASTVGSRAEGSADVCGMSSADVCGMSSNPAVLIMSGNSTVGAEFSTSSALTLTTCEKGAELGGRGRCFGITRFSRWPRWVEIRTGKGSEDAVLSGVAGAWITGNGASAATVAGMASSGTASRTMRSLINRWFAPMVRTSDSSLARYAAS